MQKAKTKAIPPEEPVRDELWTLERWLQQIINEQNKHRQTVKLLREQETLVRNIIKKWKTIK